MNVLSLQVHQDEWLAGIAKARGIDREHAALQRLDETRMCDMGLTEIEVPAPNGQTMKAKLPMRGLMYRDYAVEWTLLEPSSSTSS